MVYLVNNNEICYTYDTYGKLTARTGTTVTPFMYNGRDGVITEENGLYYMRARYYHPEIKRFINAAYIVDGEILNSIFAPISKEIDESQIINKESFWEKLSKITSLGRIYDVVDSFLDHGVETMISSLPQ